MKNKFILTSLIFIFCSIFLSAQDFYSSSMTKAFADDLYVNGFFEEAAGEYRRYLFMSEKPDFKPFDSLTNIYRSTKNFDGLDFLFNIKDKFYSKDELKKFNFIYNEGLFLRRKNILLENDYDSDFHKIIVNLSSLILEENFKQTIKTIDEYNNDESLKTDKFDELRENCSSYSKKSPLLSLSLSAIVPGLGKWYGGSFKSGFSSLLSISMTGLGTYYCYKEYGKENWRTWTLAAMTGVSYIVELYGSYQNAHRVNDAQYRKITTEMEKLYAQCY